MSLARSVPQHLGSNSNYGGGWCAPTSNGQLRSGCVLLSSNCSGVPTLTTGSNLGQTQRSRDSDRPSRQIVRNTDHRCARTPLYYVGTVYGNLLVLSHENVLDSKGLLDRLSLQERIVPPTSTHPGRQYQVVALLFHMMNAKSATVVISPTR